MQSLEKVPIKENKENKLEKAFLEQGFELISIKFTDGEDLFFITRKIEK